jgi:hypothetical protein
VRSSEDKLLMLDEAGETLPDKMASSFSLLIKSRSSEEPQNEKSMRRLGCYRFLHFDVPVKEMDVPGEMRWDVGYESVAYVLVTQTR